MTLFLWIADLLIPVVITIMGLVFKYRPPRRINMFYGYRTARSMASKQAWDTAHRIGGRIWCVVGAALTAFAVVIKLLIPVRPENPVLTFVLIGLSMAALIIPIFYIERQLKKLEQ